MTPEQLAAERVRYERFRRSENPHWAGYRDEQGQYIDIVNWSGFNAWIAAKQDTEQQRKEFYELINHDPKY